MSSRDEDVVGAAPTGDAPTTSEWSTILLPTKVRLILEVLRYINNSVTNQPSVSGWVFQVPLWASGLGVGPWDWWPGTLPLWESVGMRRGFAPHFRHLDDLFAPKNLTMSTILFRSCWVPYFEAPHFQHVDDLFAPQIDQIYHFI